MDGEHLTEQAEKIGYIALFGAADD